jgi:EmrB/QacA subfamily drug resistance transporter
MKSLFGLTSPMAGLHRCGRRWWALGALVLSILTIGLDATILNVALPTLATSVHATNSQLQWIVDAYVLVFAGLLLPAGALGDRYGRKRLMLVSLLLFGGSSAVAAFTTDPGQLIAMRAVMGIGAAILMPISMALLPVLFDEAEQGRAIAFATMGMGLGIPLGPLVGGYLLAHFWWGSIFLINVPVVGLALVAVALLVPESRDPSARPVDLLGGVLSTVGLVALVYGIIEAPDRGWRDALVLVSIGAGLAFLTGFVLWQRRAPYPMIDLNLFRTARFLWGSVAATLASFALFGLLFVVPQYLQLVRGNDAFGAGARLLPLMGGLIVAASAGDRMVRAVGTKIPVALGLAIIAAGLGWGATSTTGTGYGMTAAWLTVTGVGTGLALAPAMDAVIGTLPRERAGSGTALTQTLRQVGAALGVAILGSVLASAYTEQAPAAGRESLGAAAAVAAKTGDLAVLVAGQHAYLHAMDRVLLVCAAVALLGAVAAALFLPARQPSRAAQPASEEESAHELARLA